MDNELDPALVEAYRQAPTPIREYMESGQLETFTSSLAKRLSLAPELETIISNEVVFGLLAINDPGALEKNLTERHGIEASIAGPVASEALKSVFVPLREKVRALPAEPKPAVPDAPPINRLTPLPIPVASDPKPSVPTPVVLPKPALPVVQSKPVPPMMPSVSETPPVPKPVVATPPAAPAKPEIPAVTTPPAPPVPPVPPVPSQSSAKMRPGEPSEPVKSVPQTLPKNDPYREPVE